MDFGKAFAVLCPQAVTLWDCNKLKSISKSDYAVMSEALDTMGHLSARAQGLSSPITSASWILNHQDQRVYLLCDKRTCVGLIKVGPKQLFIRRADGSIREIRPLSVLDFYVHESMQRKGAGSALYNFMLECEGVDSHHMGYDRPSTKFVEFLKRINLKAYVPQNNNFIVFDRYFNDPPPRGATYNKTPALSGHQPDIFSPRPQTPHQQRERSPPPPPKRQEKPKRIPVETVDVHPKQDLFTNTREEPHRVEEPRRQPQQKARDPVSEPKPQNVTLTHGAYPSAITATYDPRWRTTNNQFQLNAERAKAIHQKYSYS